MIADCVLRPSITSGFVSILTYKLTERYMLINALFNYKVLYCIVLTARGYTGLSTDQWHEHSTDDRFLFPDLFYLIYNCCKLVVNIILFS